MGAPVLFAWELGDNLGHVAPFGPVARALAGRGIALHVALKKLENAHHFLEPVAGWHQAPLWSAPPGPRPPVATYADLIRPFGYADPAGLAVLVQAWRSILDAVRPAVLVADSAPTALLAARGRPIRQILYSNGYSQPPCSRPLPAMRHWDPPAPGEVARREREVVEVIARAQELLGDPPIEALADLWLGVDRRLVQGTPLFDAYAPVRPAADVEYLGPPAGVAGGALPDWPEGAGPRVFAYLSARYPTLPDLLAALDRAPARVLAYVPGVAPALRQRCPRVRFADGPLRIDETRRRADAVVCHSASGTGMAFLAAGVPALLAPMHLEQEMAARGPSASGAVRVLLPSDTSRFADALVELLSPASRRAAQELARSERWQGPDPTTAAVEAIDALASR